MTIDNNTLIGLIGGGVFSVLFGLVGYLRNKSKRLRDKRSNFFNINGIKSSDLTPFDLLGIRSSKNSNYNEYYLARDHDRILDQRLNDKVNAILIGRPLAGKTRAIYQALKNLNPARDIIVPNPDAMKTGSLQLPKNISLLKDSIVIFDDINKYATQPGFQAMLAEYTRREIQIIATCRDGNDYDQFCDQLTTEQVLFGDPIKIADATKDEIKKVEKESGIEAPNKSDGTIGSIFVPLYEMIRRYTNAKADENDILDAIKKLFDGDIFKSGEIFSVQHIKAVCQAEWGEEKSKKGWNRLLDKLAQSGFFEVNGDDIQIEEVYLEQVIPDNYKNLDNFKKLFAIFKNDFNALFALGDRTDDIGENSLQKREYKKLAINIYKACLETKKNQETSPRYAKIQNNLGIAYQTLALIEDTANNCQLAITSYENALRVRTLNDLPLDFAMTRNNLGAAYQTLAQVESVRLQTIRTSAIEI